MKAQTINYTTTELDEEDMEELGVVRVFYEDHQINEAMIDQNADLFDDILIQKENMHEEMKMNYRKNKINVF